MATIKKKSQRRCAGDMRKSESPIHSDLIAEFDAMFERMQTPEARAAMYDLFHATPEEMGKAAVAAARKKSEKPKP